LLRVNETDITPLDFTSRILVNQWKLEPFEEELTVMKVTIKGEGKTIEYKLLDRYDTATNTSSMARTTGLYLYCCRQPCLQKIFSQGKEYFPPELIGNDKNVLTLC